MTKNKCSFYNFLLFDMSQFSGFLSGHDCTTYSKVNTVTVTYQSEKNPKDLYYEEFTQNRAYEETKWSILSLDLALGLIGGLVALIWQLLELILGDYQSFKFSTALISEIYSTTAQERMMADNVPENKEQA